MTVRHGRATYEVMRGTFLDAIAALPAAAYVVTDENVWAHWGRRVDGRPALVLPAGEATKSLESYGRVLDWLALSGADRASTVVALGGGVIGDLAGFAAASFMRGIDLVQIPSTLLAQVDSSIGGKVGVNLGAGKNLAGAFYPPSRVFLCGDLLNTLPPREWRSGTAEIYKMGAILDASLFDRLAKTPLVQGEKADEVVDRCVALKAALVEEDPEERTGRRAILNFGHTVAHAIEKLSGYGPVLHGEAVAIGMLVEATLGVRLGVSGPDVPSRLASALSAQGFETRVPDHLDARGLVEAMRADKKAERGELAFALVDRIGSCKLVRDVPTQEALAALREWA